VREPEGIKAAERVGWYADIIFAIRSALGAGGESVFGGPHTTGAKGAVVSKTGKTIQDMNAEELFALS